MPDNQQGDKGNRVQVNIIDQKMRVTLRINPPANEEEQMVLQDVLDALDKTGVKYGIKEDDINSYLDRKQWGDLLVAAEGKQPGIGEDATLEFHFITTKSLRPHIGENGLINYKEVDVIGSVSKDSLLLKKNPATKGESGTNVLGEVIPGKLGKDITVTAGQGTVKDATDPNTILAAIDGIISFNQRTNTVEVQKLYVIPGSVDFSTGNVNVKSSVDIQGDVKSGFTITTPYNVSVKGQVEHATIACDGTLTVRGGIVGDGQQVIKAGCDVHSGYIRNQQIKCGGCVNVAMEILSSVVECGDTVTLIKPEGKIVGGKVIASKQIIAAFIGNKYDVPTEVAVGMNFDFREKYLAKLTSATESHKAAEEVKKKIDILNSRPADFGTNARYKILKDQHQGALEQWERLCAELKSIELDYFNVEEPSIRVLKSIYPGVTVRIKHVTYEVKEELSKVIFKLNGDEIELTKIG